MNRNVSIVVIILVLVVIAGYLVWIRSRYQSSVSPQVNEEVQAIPTVQPIQSASPSATSRLKEATGSAKAKSATSPAKVK